MILHDPSGSREIVKIKLSDNDFQQTQKQVCERYNKEAKNIEAKRISGTTVDKIGR